MSTTQPTSISPSSSQPQPLAKVSSHPQYHVPSDLSGPPSTLHPDPLIQFTQWFALAQSPENSRSSSLFQPEAFTLSTSTPNGIPSSRIVLLKQVDQKGFVFFTNYQSRKGLEIQSNPWAAMTFYWEFLHRQVRVVGKVERVEREESREYFKTRPIGSQLGAWASDQSKRVRNEDTGDESRGELEKKVKEVEDKFGVDRDEKGEAVGLKEGKDNGLEPPAWWGGYRIIPTEVEFWVGQPSRLHDRVRYTRVAGDDNDLRKEGEKVQWQMERLFP